MNHPTCLRRSRPIITEIAYNLEHTIHHMALIRVGLHELGDITLDDSYGVAPSTLKYRKRCVQ
jgi:hypothetical protein